LLAEESKTLRRKILHPLWRCIGLQIEKPQLAGHKKGTDFVVAESLQQQTPIFSEHHANVMCQKIFDAANLILGTGKKDNVLKMDAILQVFKALANKRRRRRSQEMLQSCHHILQKMSTSRHTPNIAATPNFAPKNNSAFKGLYLAKDFFVILRVLFKTSYFMT